MCLVQFCIYPSGMMKLCFRLESCQDFLWTGNNFETLFHELLGEVAPLPRRLLLPEFIIRWNENVSEELRNGGPNKQKTMQPSSNLEGLPWVHRELINSKSLIVNFARKLFDWGKNYSPVLILDFSMMIVIPAKLGWTTCNFLFWCTQSTIVSSWRPSNSCEW